MSTPQVSVPQSGPTVQTSIQMPTGQDGPSTISMSQPYQGQYQSGPTVQNLAYRYQLYPGYIYQQPQQPQFGLVNLGFRGGHNIPNANLIPCYPRYPPPRAGLITQRFREHNHQLPFIATLDLPDLLHLTNDLIYYVLYWRQIPNKFPSDISKFEGKSGDDPLNHVMTYHL